MELELFEKKNSKIDTSNHEEIKNNINDLENSLEELKEITIH